MTPFSVNETRMLDCQFGQKYYKQKPKQGKKMWLQGTRNMGCMTHIEVKTSHCTQNMPSAKKKTRVFLNGKCDA